MILPSKIIFIGKTASLVSAFGFPIAQVAGLTSTELSPLINLGAIGGILTFILLKLDPRLRRVEEAIDRLSRIVALAVIAMESAPAAVKHQATMVIRELDDAAAERAAQNKK